MKTAISVPDEVFREADLVAQRLGWTRSKLYAHAVQEFLNGQDEHPITTKLNELADELSAEPTPNVIRDLVGRGHAQW